MTENFLERTKLFTTIEKINEMVRSRTMNDRNEKTPPLAFGPTILTQLYFFVAHDIYISKL